MNFINPGLIGLLGIINLFFLVLIIFSCRCFLGTKIYLVLLQKRWFKKFYQYHCWYWWGLVVSVFFHTLFAFLIFGFPFRL